MKVTREKTENSQAYLTIEMETAEVEDSLEKSYRKLVQKTKIPGFRQGKTPRSIFERYYGHEKLLEEAIDDLVPEAYEKALKEESIDAIANPELEITQTEPLVFKAIVPLKPTVKLGDYRSIRIPEEPPKETTDKDIDEVIDSLRHQHANWEPVTREVMSRDLVTMDIESTVEDKPFINEKGGQYQAIGGEVFPAPGFAEQVIGMKSGEEKEFTLKFGDDDVRTALAGKEGQFKVKVIDIKQENLPEVNDDFAKLISADFQTIAALREKVTNNLKQSAEERSVDDYENKVVDTAVEQSQVEFPEVLVVNEIHRMIEQRFRTKEQLEAYLKSVNKTEEELHEEMHVELHPVAETRVRRALVLADVADEEKVKATDAEIDAEVERLVKSSAGEPERLQAVFNTPEVRESLKHTLLAKKTVERLVEIAKGADEANKEKEEGK